MVVPVPLQRAVSPCFVVGASCLSNPVVPSAVEEEALMLEDVEVDWLACEEGAIGEEEAIGGY
jgi:hypothetical protein